MRAERRVEILRAFATVMARHGYVGATIAAVAAEAGVAPGLVHHHFDSKQELLEALLAELTRGFRQRVQGCERDRDPLVAYIDGALALDDRADIRAARCWVGLFAEAARNPALFRRVRRLIDREIGTIRARSGGRLSDHQAAAVLAFVIGALVMGAFAPRKTAGFAAPALQDLVHTMLGPKNPEQRI